MAGLLNFSTQLGNYGSFSVAEAAGKVTAAFTLNKSLGGGSTAGWLTVSESLSVVGNGTQAVDAAFLLAEQKWAVAAPELALAKTAFDAFIAGN